ncbi:MAG: hypothetical protein WA421_07680 [Nitrososphaeraceae archaeon]|jgi:hypothetical protein
MVRINEVKSDSILREFKNDIRIHEHDFISIRGKEEKSIICLTCGSLYCEKCGKLLVTTHDKKYMQHTIYN